jgi:cardiolipin synthase
VYGISVITLVLAGAIALLGLVIWSIKHHRDPHLHIHCGAPLSELLPSLAGLTHGAVVEGNAVELLENGAFFDELFADMKSARHSVHFETFLWKDGRLSERLVDALIERARAGAAVRVLVDANGGKKMGKATRRRLVEAGCKLAIFHPWSLRNIGVLPERDHRKLVVLDGRTAFVGGHCIVDSWLGNGEDREHVRDIGVRLRGPVVHAVQATFAENWVEETGDLFLGEHVFPKLDKAGDVEVHVAEVKPEGSAPAVKILHHVVLACAAKRIFIQNPYFLPEPAAIEAMARAVERGVDVRVMVPSASASDMPLVQHAAHRNFERLLACGVRIFEYPKTLLHQKVMTVDGAWCAIGSSNFDDRSFETNDEITLGFRDAGLARRLEAIFERDSRECVELKLETWSRRGAFHRLKDSALYLANEVL